VTSSYPLSKTELSHLQKAIAQKFHKHNITINNVVDPTIIGGIKIKSNSHSIDETLKNKLMLMRENVVSGGSTRR
jgi:F-type H+-transporting ATPase subunit delta